MSVEKNVSPTAVASGGGGRWLEKEKKRGKKEEERKKNDVNRDEKEKESKRDSLWLCVLFYRQSTVARSLSLARFSKISFFFRGLIRHWYVLIVTCAKFWWSFTPFFLSFFLFFFIGICMDALSLLKEIAVLISARFWFLKWKNVRS